VYQPPQFREDRLAVQHDLIRAYPLGLLITAGRGGLLANPIPFVLDAAASEKGVLKGHLARANRQAGELENVLECLVVFQGPHGYVSPSWYATKRDSGKVVPTWNYATVHAWGRPTVITDETWLRAQIAELTTTHEAKRPQPWAVTDAPEQFIRSQIKGIIGLSIEITKTEGKWKVSQNRSAADRDGVSAGFAAEGDAGTAMAALVDEHNRDFREP
jgi:transcriptional regulator